jgi:fructosamine-3-kinase
MNPAFIAHLQEKLTAYLDQPVRITDTETIRGGDINHSFLVKTSVGNYFIKHNSSLYGLDFFEKEAQGLSLLASADALPVSKPLFHGQFHQQLYLVLEYFSKGEASHSFWRKFGEGLAALHQKTCKDFGLDHDNYIGSLPQTNNPSFDWSAFYFHQRVGKLIIISFKRGQLESHHLDWAEGLSRKLPSIFPGESPALLHGDLWSGNFSAQSNGLPIIYDPAVYYGHREMDLAMTRLFGGFDSAFYDAYQHAYPLLSGWEERLEICQLYPLLVHLNLFGGHYLREVLAILSRYK